MLGRGSRIAAAPCRRKKSRVSVSAIGNQHQSHGKGSETWRQLLEALPSAVYTTDAAGRVTFYNEAAVELSGHRPELGSAALACEDGRCEREIHPAEPEGIVLPEGDEAIERLVDVAPIEDVQRVKMERMGWGYGITLSRLGDWEHLEDKYLVNWDLVKRFLASRRRRPTSRRAR